MLGYTDFFVWVVMGQVKNEDRDQVEWTSFGDYLRLAREERGLSLDVMAEHTKVRIQHLHAIESSAQGEELSLPLAYYRGYAKTYAQYMGVDISNFSEEINRLYPLEYDSDQQNDTQVYNTVHNNTPTLGYKSYLGLGFLVLIMTAGLVFKRTQAIQSDPVTTGNLMENPTAILQSQELH